MNVSLSTEEAMALCGDLDHSPACAWSEPVGLQIVVEEGGDYPKGVWLDQECTIPYVEPACTCGFHAILEAARSKLRSAMAT